MYSQQDLIYYAFRKACKYFRDHPPYDAGMDGDMEILSLIVDAESDPEGIRWANYFLIKAKEELNGENKDEEYW